MTHFFRNLATRISFSIVLFFIGFFSIFSQSVEIDENGISLNDQVTILDELLVDPDGDGPQQPLLRITAENGIEIFYVGKYRSLEEAVVGMVDPETIDEQSIIVDGAGTPRIDPGVYNNVTFTGDGTMGVGKYLIYGDFIVNPGVTVTIETLSEESETYAFFGEEGKKPSGYTTSLITHIGGYGVFGGGNGRDTNVWSKMIISADDLPKTYRHAGGGGGGPCGSSLRFQGGYYCGGGWVLLDVFGRFNNAGHISADGENAGNEDTGGFANGGGSGGYIGIRSHTANSFFGSLSCNGGAGGNDGWDGGGGGGGVIEIYHLSHPDSDTNPNIVDGINGGPYSVIKGNRGRNGSDGIVRTINADDFQYLYINGAQSDEEDYSDDPDMGLIIEMLGGWPMDGDVE